MQQAKFKKMAAVAAASVFGGFGIAHGSLTINMVQDGTNATSVSVTPGQAITLDVIGTVTGTNGTADEGLQSVFGGVLSSKAGFVTFLDQTSPTPSAVGQSPFSLLQAGVNQSFNGGDMLGTTLGGTSTNAVSLRDGNGIATSPSVDSASFLLAKITFSVTAAASGTSQVSFIPYTSSSGGGSKLGGTWQQDGGTPLTGATGTELTGTAVTLTSTVTPEPGSIALLGLGGLGLLLRRRSAV